MNQFKALVQDLVTAVVLGVLMFSILLIFRTTGESLVSVPLGFGAIYFLSARWRHSRKEISSR
jgi:hypothetical protein